VANSGWTNDAVDTLTVPTGATSGERVIIANQSNGDAIDIYDAANQLVFSIDKNGRLVSYSSVNTAEVVMVGGSLFFEDSAQNPQIPPQELGLLAPDSTTLVLSGGIPANAAVGVQAASLQLNTGDAQANAWIQASQRGVDGAMVQTGTGTNASQLTHSASYSGTTNAGGHLVITHGCGFTPAVMVVTGTTAGGTFANLTYGVNSKTPTQADVNWTVANTGAAYANQVITFDAVFFG
jgi:hypothetical protein